MTLITQMLDALIATGPHSVPSPGDGEALNSAWGWLIWGSTAVATIGAALAGVAVMVRPERNAGATAADLEGHRPTKWFTGTYRHDGKTWSIRFKAYDWGDAEARIAALGETELDGELVGEIPADLPGAGRWARVICVLGNSLGWLRGRKRKG